VKLVFAGTPAFAVPSLAALHAAGHELAAIFTQPDRPAGRGRKLTPSPIKTFAVDHGLDVRQPETLGPDAVESLAAIAPEAFIVVAYGLLLPPPVLAIPRHGCINVHASLLPRWRGAAPIARAIEAGDTMTGVCIMRMEAGLDTGPVYRCESTRIGETETTAALEIRLADLGAQCLTDALSRAEFGELSPIPQSAKGVTYARKLRKDEGRIDWRQDAAVLHRKIRAFNPWPVAVTTWNDKTLRLWDVAPLSAVSTNPQTPGTVLAASSDGLIVQAGTGALTITRLQLEGGRVLSVGEFLNGCRLQLGQVLGRTGTP